LRVALLTMIGGALVDPVQAQTTQLSGSSSMSDSSTGGLQEVIVTARKRDERLLDVPAAISVITGEALARTGTSSLENMASQLPQVMITPSMGASTGASITIRGFGSNTAADSAIEQAVSLSIDDVSSARGRLVTQALFDLADIQVLKGPQALYFGKNSPAGVIVVTSKDPGKTLDGYGRAGYEFEAHEYRLEGAIGGPVTDAIGIRLAVYRADMLQGYVKNIAGPIPAASSPVLFDKANGIDLPGAAYEWGPQSKQTAVRLTTVFDPDTNFDAKLKLTYADYRDNGDSSTQVNTSCPVGSNSVQQVDLGGILFVGGSGVVVTDPYNTCGKGRFEQAIGRVPAQIAGTFPDAGNGVPYLKTKAGLASLTMNYRFTDTLTLTSVTGYYHGDMSNLLGADNTSFTLIPATFEEHSSTTSEELRLNSHLAAPVNFMVGAFYDDQKLDTPFVSGLIRAADPRPGFDEVYSAAGTTDGKGTTVSGFGEVYYNITPELELAGGARYTDERKHAVLYNSYVNPIADAFGVTLAQGIQVYGRTDNSNVSPQATLTWKMTPDVSIYGAYRTGFKSGGIIHPGLIPAAVNPALPASTRIPVTYDPEKVKGGETGLKFQLYDRRLTGSLTGYYYRYTGLQVSAFDTNTNVVFLKNAGSASAKGLEGDLNFQATSALALRGAFGYNKARYDSFANSACFAGQSVAGGCTNNEQDLTGRPLPRAPNWTSSIGATYDQPITGRLALGFSVDGRFTAGYFTTPQDSPYAYQGGYTLIDTSIRLHDINEHWDLALIGRNLTDKFYAVVASDKPLAVAPGSVYSQVGVPRTVLLQGTYNF
jgi:iron complex outermembrane recepter protein